jgi:hypothetical protein
MPGDVLNVERKAVPRELVYTRMAESPMQKDY